MPDADGMVAHIDEAVQNCENAVNSVGAVSASCTFVGLPAIAALPAGMATLPDRLKTLPRNLLDASILLDKDGEALSRAIDRIIDAKKPARKGGQGAKDAAILEHSVSLVDALLVGGFTARRAFVSSNTGDFATAKITDIHPDIRPSFAPPRDVRYCVNLFAAVTWLKANAWVP